MDKKDKEWLKDEVNDMPLRFLGFSVLKLRDEFGVNKGDVLALIDQLDEPQKPVIPQFVADYIEKYKDEGLSLGGWFIFNSNDHEIYDWLCLNNTAEEKRRREYLFIDAIRNGYTVEKGKKYYIDLDTAAYVAKWKGDGSVQIYTDSISGSDEYELHLTEKEIKDYDERYWAFAEEVKE